jgi:hypothetical protein
MSAASEETVCEWCGATGCVAIFDRCLASEFNDPEFFAVHHLSVPAYGLQHGKYDSEAAAAVAAMMLAHVEEAPTTTAAASLCRRFDGPARVRRRSSHARHVAVPVSIASVEFTTAAAYAASVRAWAEAVARSVVSS